jgi:hypothetical protein
MSSESLINLEDIIRTNKCTQKHEARDQGMNFLLACWLSLFSAVEFKICFRKIKTRERYVRLGCGRCCPSVNVVRTKRSEFMVY